MNGDIKGITYAAVSVAVFVPGILFVGDYIYFQHPMEQIRIWDDPLFEAIPDGMRAGYLCYEASPEGFVCRPDRQTGFSGGEIRFASAGPVSYGEIAWVPEGKADPGVFSITSLEIVDHVEGMILVGFGYSPGSGEGGLFHTATMLPGDTYVTDCARKSAHLVTYTDLVATEEGTYAEFWGVHASMHDELVPCDLPKMIKRSLEFKYEMDLPEYDDEHVVV